MDHCVQISDAHPQGNPGFFEDDHPSVGGIDEHFVQHTHWCWTEDNLDSLLASSAQARLRAPRWATLAALLSCGASAATVSAIVKFWNYGCSDRCTVFCINMSPLRVCCHFAGGLFVGYVTEKILWGL